LPGFILIFAAQKIITSPMNKFLFWSVLGLVFISCQQSPREIVIAEDRKSNYRIIFAEEAPDSLRTAIEILQNHLRLMTGADVKAYSDIVVPQAEEILVGKSKRMEKYLNKIPLADLGSGYYEGVHDKKWIIMANSASAILSGIYDIVGRLGSVKVSQDLTQFTQVQRFTRSSDPYIFKPTFSYRQAVTPLANNDQYRAFNQININNTDDWGTWAYSMERIFPATSYFSSKPQYFAEIQGKRLPAQVNFSDPRMKEDLTKNLEVWTMSKGLASYWSIGPYSNRIVSEDELTRKAIGETGSPSGALLQLVNEIAAENKSRTYAIWLDGPYRIAPDKIQPLNNVMVVLDTRDVDHAVSLGEGQTNETFRRDLAAWKRQTTNIAVVSHLTNEEKFMMPFPNLYALQRSLKYLDSEGVDKIIFVGNSFIGSAMPDLKFYVASNLAWNVDQPVDTLIKRYCDNKYGVAAASMYAYVRALETTLQSTKSRLYVNGSPSDGFRSWLQPTNINQLYSYFSATTSVTGNNPDLRDLVLLERLSLIYTQLEVAKSMGTNTYGYFMNIGALSQLIRQENTMRQEKATMDIRKKDWGTIQGMRDLLDQFVNDCDRMSVRVVDAKGTTPAQYRTLVQKYIDQQIQTHFAFKRGTFTFNVSPDPYFADGAETILYDGVAGLAENPQTNWMGVSGGAFEVTWTNDKDTILKSLTTRFLQNTEVRAWLPTEVSCLVSADGTSFTEVNTVRFGPETLARAIRPVTFNLGNRKIKAIKLKASGLKTCPPDNIQSGLPAALVVDELEIR